MDRFLSDFSVVWCSLGPFGPTLEPFGAIMDPFLEPLWSIFEPFVVSLGYSWRHLATVGVCGDTFDVFGTKIPSRTGCVSSCFEMWNYNRGGCCRPGLWL